MPDREPFYDKLAAEIGWLAVYFWQMKIKEFEGDLKEATE